MAGARHCSSWAHLQPELLGLVLRRLPSLADRVRVAAVCRPWRHSARLETLPPPFPWLTLRNCTFLNILDGKIYCLPSVPPGNSKCYGSVGNWLFLEQYTGDGGSPPMSLMNPFSKNIMQLPDADTIWHYKPEDGGHPSERMLLKMVLLSSSMDLSPDSLFAVHIITNWSLQSVISICQPTTASAFRVPGHEYVRDIAYVDGKLYVISVWKLFVLEVDQLSGKCKPKIPSMKCIANDVHNPGILRKTIAGKEYVCVYWDYLVESSGKLLHVRREIGCLSVLPEEDRMEHRRTISFDVFEVDLTTSSSVQWRQINSLGGEALFVGPCSKVVQSSEHGAQADYIYFICDYNWGCSFEDPFRDSGVFNMRNGTITPLLPKTMIRQAPKRVAKERSANKFYSARPSWFFPY